MDWYNFLRYQSLIFFRLVRPAPYVCLGFRVSSVSRSAHQWFGPGVRIVRGRQNFACASWGSESTSFWYPVSWYITFVNHLLFLKTSTLYRCFSYHSLVLFYVVVRFTLDFYVSSIVCIFFCSWTTKCRQGHLHWLSGSWPIVPLDTFSLSPLLFWEPDLAFVFSECLFFLHGFLLGGSVFLCDVSREIRKLDIGLEADILGILVSFTVLLFFTLFSWLVQLFSLAKKYDGAIGFWGDDGYCLSILSEHTAWDIVGRWNRTQGLDGDVREGQPTICSSYIGGWIHTVGII